MDDQEMIQGTWTLVSGECKGKSLPDETVKQVKLILSADRLITKNMEHKTEAAFTLDSNKEPREIDVDMEGNVGKGIYQLNGDEVGDARPNQFPKSGSGLTGSGLTVLVLKREMPETNPTRKF